MLEAEVKIVGQAKAAHELRGEPPAWSEFLLILNRECSDSD